MEVSTSRTGNSAAERQKGGGNLQLYQPGVNRQASSKCQNLAAAGRSKFSPSAAREKCVHRAHARTSIVFSAGFSITLGKWVVRAAGGRIWHATAWAQQLHERRLVGRYFVYTVRRVSFQASSRADGPEELRLMIVHGPWAMGQDSVCRGGPDGEVDSCA